MTKLHISPITPFPLLRSQAYYIKRNIAGFKLLKHQPIYHGFSYGKGSQNMSYKWEPGFIHEATQHEAIQRVKIRIACYLAQLHMEDITKSVYLQALSGDTRILDLSTTTLALNEYSDRGIFLPGGAIFTTLPRIPLLMTSGDCHTLTIYALNRYHLPIIGLIHAGRRELDALLPLTALNHLITYYSCDPSHIQLGIVQGIGPNSHTIQPQHLTDELKNLSMWEPYIKQPLKNGPFHLDNLTLLFDQIKSVSIPNNNIEAYTSDNVVLAQNGITFSHRARQGRMLISVQLQ